MVVPLSLQEIVARSGQAFVGRCLSVDPTIDENGLPAVFIDFEVSYPIKDADVDIISMKQFGTVEGDPENDFLPPLHPGESAIVVMKSGTGSAIHYQPDEEVVLFVYGKSELGFSSPVGLGQGLFRIHEDDEGRVWVTNNTQNVFLKLPPENAPSVNNLSTSTTRTMPLDFDTLVDLAEEMVGP